MPQNNENYTFEISLSVLNHLGRNLYRSFITVLGEAISNSWDADAKNVWIYIDKANGNFVIKDDGVGMTTEDFQKKFLRVGYSKRKTGGVISPSGRPYIGAKGIGKLALLSCAEKVSVISKNNDTEYTGGVIDNSGLDEAIEHEITPDKYPLEEVNYDLFTPYREDHDKGTIIYFENTKDGIKNTVEYLKKLIALHFKFALIDPAFNIFVDEDLVTYADLQGLADSTEFLWKINGYTDQFIEEGLTSLKETEDIGVETMTANGFVASVVRPRDLKIATSNEKAGIDLFVNGRLREKDILKHMPDFSTRFVASYLYGQIHFNDLDTETTDKVFTSSREGVVDDNEAYKELLDTVKSKILEHISNEWDQWRLKHDQQGDDDNEQNKGKKERYAKYLVNESAANYMQAGDVNTKRNLKTLKAEAEFNVPAYTDCFLSENIIRHYLRDQQTPIPPDVQTRIDDQYKVKEATAKANANININLRQNNDDLGYLSMDELAYIADPNRDRIREHTLIRDSVDYKPGRDALMHTSLLTEGAKQRLRTTYENIEGRIRNLLNGNP